MVTSVTISVGWAVSVTTDVIATSVDEVNDNEPKSARDGAPETARPFDKAINISTEPAGWGPNGNQQDLGDVGLDGSKVRRQRNDERMIGNGRQRCEQSEALG